ncbi:MAG: VanZ family protein [Amphritea sp.]
MNHQLRYLQLWLIIGLLLVGAVIYFSLAPVPQQLQIEFQLADKVEHTLAYSILMLWFGQLTLIKARLVSALLLILLGVALEFLQEMTAYRQFDIFDMAANTIGVLLGLYLSSYCFNNSFEKTEQLINKRYQD